MSITNSNLYSGPYNAIKTFIDGLNIDPKKRYRGNWIHASMPNINGKDFEGYPFIIITTDIGENKPSLDTRVSEKIFKITISVWSPESTDIDTISDNIFSSLQNFHDFQIISLNASPFSWDLDRNGKKVLFRNINLIARCRI